MSKFAYHGAPVALAVSLAAVAGTACAAPFMIVGLDEKVSWNEKGERLVAPTGHDAVLIADLARPEHPKIVARLPLENSVTGPPVNVAISPDGALALVADSETVAQDGGKLNTAATDKLFVIDLKAKPAQLVQTLKVGRQPSGLSFSPGGDLALLGFRAEKSLGVLKIERGRAREIGRLDIGDTVSHVVFAPDGRRALAVEPRKIAVLNVDGDKVTDTNLRIPLPAPYNIEVSPAGQIALATNGRTVSAIDLAANPPKVVGDAPVAPGVEGLAVSPQGQIAVAAAIQGSNIDHRSPAYHRNGVAVALRLDGTKLTPIKQIDVGAVPEAVGFTPDGRYVYVGNFLDQDFSILRVNGTEVIDTGKRFKTPGHPASARISPR